jgi:hypothetical protein
LFGLFEQELVDVSCVQAEGQIIIWIPARNWGFFSRVIFEVKN